MAHPTRWRFSSVAGIFAVVALAANAAESGPRVSSDAFSFETVVNLARETAGKPFEARQSPDRADAPALDYENYRAIHYRPEYALWNDAPAGYQLQFYHCGYLFSHPVAINTVENGTIRPVLYKPELFDYGNPTRQKKAEATPGFGGFRVHAVRGPADNREALSFLGASYFRGAPRAGTFGASGRGLAVNIGLGKAEEFPEFRVFWIERPRAGTPLSIFALLDSPSVTGAYRFDCEADETTALSIETYLYFRSDVENIGIAPLTSEFFYGENQPPPAPDAHARPEVHDSDGLLVAAGSGEVLWRPLINPVVNRTYSFAGEMPRGFGLVQRDRDPSHYADANAPEKRANIWVEPSEGFSRGAVRLLELAATAEWSDNIAAYWTPDESPKAGAHLHLKYRLLFALEGPAQMRSVKVVRTLRSFPAPNRARYDIDFAGDAVAQLPSDELWEPVVSATPGELTSVKIGAPESGARRVSFDVTRAEHAPITLRAFIRSRQNAVSETWTDTWEP